MALSPGQIVDGKYRVVRMIGEGGMGAVYEGANERIGRRVAIKVMHAEAIANTDLLRRFQREAMAAAKIGSAHIVDVLDLGDLPNGESYMVMEYLEGESLAGRIAAGRLPATDAVLIAHQLLEGLGAMHAAGIIHRDLKPANIFLSRTSKGEVVKILDFGVSKFTTLPDDPDLLTRSGAVMGTPHYMSPEQARGNNKEVDQRTDIYALGVILYRAVSGALPFDGENFHELLFKIALEAPPPLEGLVPDLSPELAQIIMRAMSRDASARYQSADEMRAAIEDWGRSQGRPSLAFERTLRTSGRMVPASQVVVSVNPASQSERLKAATEGKSTPTAWSESDAANANARAGSHKGGTLVAAPAGSSANAASSPGRPPSVAPPTASKNRSLVGGLAAAGVLLVAVSLVFVVKTKQDGKAGAPAVQGVPAQIDPPASPPVPPPPPAPAPPATDDPMPPPTATSAPLAVVPPPRPVPGPATAKPFSPPPPSSSAAAPPASAAPQTAPATSVHGRKIRTDL